MAVFDVLVVFSKETKLCEGVDGVFFSILERYSVDIHMYGCANWSPSNEGQGLLE